MKKRVKLCGLSSNGRECPCVWLTDEACEAHELLESGSCVVFVLTKENREVSLPAIRYCLELPENRATEEFWAEEVFAEETETDNFADGRTAGWREWISEEYLERIWQRHAGQPWHILDTDRLCVREMTEDDLDALYMLHSDSESERFLDRLLPDREEERSRLREYIRHMYGFYEFGMWLVTLRTGEIIGRAGLQLRDGFDTPELGFSIAAPYRRQGYAEEVCRAVLEYGVKELELSEIRAVVHRDNKNSRHLCEKLGFVVDNSAREADEMWIGFLWKGDAAAAAEKKIV